VLSRLFAFDRGLFEDKVSNIWCAISPVIKLRTMLSQSGLVYLATAATLAGVAPSAIDLMRCVQPGPRRLIWAMFNSAMAFFVFSYQGE
jgi:alpha-1,3-glucosyltransferase